jgi:hypothetical protein
MPTYKEKLKENDSLSALYQRLDEAETNAFVEDLIFGKVYGLIKKGYLTNDRFSTPQEQALHWLYDSPFHVKRANIPVFDALFRRSIKSENWDKLNILLTITNLNKKGVSQGLIEQTVLETQLPKLIELKLYLTILNFDIASPEKMLSKRSWIDTIELGEKPYLAIVFMTKYKKGEPLKALGYFSQIEHVLYDIPEKEIRFYFQNVLEAIIINFFNIYSHTESEFKTLFADFDEWASNINALWIRNLIIDVLTLSKLEVIKDKILKIDSSFLEKIENGYDVKSLPIEKAKVEWHKQYPKPPDIPQFIKQFKMINSKF